MKFKVDFYSPKQGKLFSSLDGLENLKSHIFPGALPPGPTWRPSAVPKTSGRNFQDFQENSLSSMYISYGFGDKLIQQGPRNSEFKKLNFLIFRPIFLQIFAK